MIGTPNRIRTGVAAVKGQCPRPLDDGCMFGLGGRIRTANIWFWRPAFCQLELLRDKIIFMATTACLRD
jgi:hypothetical protein